MDDGNEWKQLGKTTSYWSWMFVKDSVPVNTEGATTLFGEVCRWIPGLAGAKSGYAIHNPKLRDFFEIQMDRLLGNVTARKQLFYKNDWEQESDADRRRYFVEQLKAKITKPYPWQNGVAVSFCY